MLDKSRIGRTAFFNWLTLAAAIGVAFFLSPFVVRQLGGIGYGVWTLVCSLVAYMAVLDFGLRGAVTRFVSKYHAQGDHDEAGRAVSAAFWLRVWLGAAILAGSVVLSFAANSFIPIPPEMQSAARWAIFLVGASLTVTITFGIFGGVLAALQRFDLLCAVGVTQTLLRAGGIVWLLSHGHGIVALAVWELFVVILANGAVTFLALHVYKEIHLLFRKPDAAVVRQLGGYSFYVVVLNACSQIINYTDNLVVGAFAGVAAVTIFTIAGGLLEYTRQMVSALGLAFVPMASSMDAQGQNERIKQLLIHGTCATLLVALPIEAALFFRGHTFIGLWMGEQYAVPSARILQILLIGQVFLIADYAAFNIACGLGKHKPIAMRFLVEAGANLALSIVLVRTIGIEGVAWGTVGPSLVNHMFFGPRYICKTLQIPVGGFILKSWLRPMIAVIPFAFACHLADRYWVATSLFQFALQVMALLPLFVLGVLICFWGEISQMLRANSQWLIRNRDAALALVKRP